MILEKVVHPGEPLASARRKVERILLSSADLARHRQRATTDAGRDVGISLPQGATLKDGDVLHCEEDLAIVVEQAEEDLLWIRPRSAEEFGRMGYQVGNLHRAAMVDARGIAVLYDRAIEALALRFQVPFERLRGKFCPVQNTGHSHG